MKYITAGDLDVAYIDFGPTDGPPVVLLHGFPYDVHAYGAAIAPLAAAGRRCIVPYLRGHGPTRFRSADTFRSGQQAALGADLLALLDALGLPQATLAGYDWGGRAACVVAALWPQRVRGLVSCGTAYNIQDTAAAREPAAPEKEHRDWYWYYLNAERGRRALVQDRVWLCRFLWRAFSPSWPFSEDDFTASAAAFDNPDFVEVVLHSYRFRIGEVAGDPRFDDVERRLATLPTITVPSIVLMGQDDGVDPPEDRARIAPRFAELRGVKILPGIGHNLPQEAPIDLVEAVLKIGGAG